MNIFTAVSWREQVIFWWNDDDYDGDDEMSALY